MIMRGTTVKHGFSLPAIGSSVKNIYATYRQNGVNLFEKADDDIWYDPDNNMIYVLLSQEDTLKFTFYGDLKKDLALVQIRFTTEDGRAYASIPTKLRIGGIFKDGEI